MSANTVQLFTALTSVATFFLGAYAVVILSWYQKTLKLYDEDKEKEEKLRVAKEKTAGGSINAVQSAFAVGGTGGGGGGAGMGGGSSSNSPSRKKTFGPNKNVKTRPKQFGSLEGQSKLYF